MTKVPSGWIKQAFLLYFPKLNFLNFPQVSKDTHLLCLNAMCDNDVKCGKDCLGHVTELISTEDLPKWRQCTYSTSCAGIPSYELRKECADECLNSHKVQLRKAKEMRMLQEEEQKKKEAEALLQSASGARAPIMASPSLLLLSLIHI